MASTGLLSRLAHGFVEFCLLLVLIDFVVVVVYIYIYIYIYLRATAFAAGTRKSLFSFISK